MFYIWPVGIMALRIRLERLVACIGHALHPPSQDLVCAQKEKPPWLAAFLMISVIPGRGNASFQAFAGLQAFGHGADFIHVLRADASGIGEGASHHQGL